MAEDLAPAEPFVLTLPREIDLTNADSVCAQLCDAIAAVGSVVIADLTSTRFCDSCGFRMLLVAHDRAVAEGRQLRIVVEPGAPVSRALALIGFDQVLRVYPSLAGALTP